MRLFFILCFFVLKSVITNAQAEEVTANVNCNTGIVTICFSGDPCIVSCPPDEVRLRIDGTVFIIKNGDEILPGYKNYTSGDCKDCYEMPTPIEFDEGEHQIEVLLDLDCSQKSGSCDGCTFIGQMETVALVPELVEGCPPCEVSLRDQTICEGDSTVLTPNTGGKEVDYLWSTGETSSTIIATGAETYGVTVTDARGCSAKASATVVVNESYVIEQSIELCAGEVFEGEEVTEDFIFVEELQTHLGCDSSIVIEVFVNESPSVQLETVKPISCFGGNNGELIAVSSEDSISFAWSNGTKGPIAENLSAGSYYVTATNAEGCSATDSTLLSQPDSLGISVQVDSISCHGAEDGVIRLEGIGGKAPYFFSGEGVHQYGPVELKDLAPGTYVFSVSDEPECVTVDSVIITEPAEINLSIETKDETCFGGSDGEITITATGGTGNISFEFIPGNSSMNLSSGIYSIFAADENGCEESSEVEIFQPEPLSYSVISVNPTACNERTGAIEIETSGGTRVPFVQWANGQSGSSLEGLEEGVYFGEITDENGCSIEIQPISVPVVAEKKLYFPNSFSPNLDGLNDRFYPMGGACSGVEEIDLSIFDRWGERVFKKNMGLNKSQEGWDGTFQRKPMDPATFLWTAVILYEDGSTEEKAGEINLIR